MEKKRNRNRSNPLQGFLKNYRLFNIHWDSYSSKNEKNKYVLSCYLPGIKPVVGKYETEKEAKRTAEFVYLYWLEKTGLYEQMTWKKEMPKEPGYYWFKNENRIDDEQPHILKVRKYVDELAVGNCSIKGSSLYETGEWAGPMFPPEIKKERKKETVALKKRNI